MGADNSFSYLLLKLFRWSCALLYGGRCRSLRTTLISKLLHIVYLAFNARIDVPFAFSLWHICALLHDLSFCAISMFEIWPFASYSSFLGVILLYINLTFLCCKILYIPKTFSQIFKTRGEKMLHNPVKKCRPITQPGEKCRPISQPGEKCRLIKQPGENVGGHLVTETGVSFRLWKFIKISKLVILYQYFQHENIKLVWKWQIKL